MNSNSLKAKSLGDYFCKMAVEKRHSPASPEVQSFMDFEIYQEENHL